jgi:hypothetical protein
VDQDRHLQRAVPRARQQVAFGLAAIAAIAAACGGTTHEAAPTAAASGLPCDVDTVLAANCRGCHSSPPQHGAPMSLGTHDAVRAVAPKIAVRIANDADPMPPAPNARLSEADRATLTRWIDAGAPASTETCAPPPGPLPPASPVSCTPDVSLRPTSKWTMPKDSGDQYVCYGFDIDRPTPTHVTAFEPRIDNTKIVHHVVLYEAPESVSGTPTPCDAGGSLRWRMVSCWAPGGKGMELPAGVGFPLRTDGPTHYVLVLHYSNPLGLEGETDESGYDLCTEAPRAEEADVLAFGTQSFTIPATGQPFTRDCTVEVPPQLAGKTLFAAMPHMHKLGTAMSTVLERAGSPDVDLGTVASWSFDTQPWLAIDPAGETRAGDVIRTKCTWTNDTGVPVGFGEKTADEMCYSFTMYYPRVTLSQWSWAAPAAMSNCK